METVVLDFLDGNVKIIEHTYISAEEIEKLLFTEDGYNLSHGNTQWMSAKDIWVNIDGELKYIPISELLDTLKIRAWLNLQKVEFQERLTEYQEAYIPWNTESLNILEYGENEFFWGKKEVYEEILMLFEKYWI